MSDNSLVKANALPEPEIILSNAMHSEDLMGDIRAHLEEALPDRFFQWITNLADRMTSLYTVRLNRNLLNIALKAPKGSQSGVHVLGVDFTFAHCDSAVVISIAGIFPESTLVEDVKDFDLLRDAQAKVDQPVWTISESGNSRRLEDMPSLLEDSQSLCVRLLEEDINAAKAVFPPPRCGSLVANTVESTRTQAHPKGTTAWFRDIILPLIFIEHQQGSLSPLQGMDQTRFYLISGVSYLAAIGIIDFPIFGVSTVGSRGRLLCAWGARQKGSERIRIHVADTNCPEWDISDLTQAIRFALFLINLRTIHRDALVARFEAVRETFLEAWEDREADGSPINWTVEAQRKEAAYMSVKKRRDGLEQSDVYKKITELRSKLKTSSSAK